MNSLVRGGGRAPMTAHVRWHWGAGAFRVHRHTPTRASSRACSTRAGSGLRRSLWLWTFLSPGLRLRRQLVGRWRLRRISVLRRARLSPRGAVPAGCGGITPFLFYGGPGYPSYGFPNFYGGVGPLAVERPVVTIDDQPRARLFRRLRRLYRGHIRIPKRTSPHTRLRPRRGDSLRPIPSPSRSDGPPV